MHGALKPWKLDTTDTRRFVELVKTTKVNSPLTNADLHKQITALLTDFPTAQRYLPLAPNSEETIQPLQYTTDFPNYKDPITNFYYFVITTETLRVYNAVLLQAATLTDLVYIQYQMGKVLNDIKVLAKQTAAELREQGFITRPDESSNHIHFTLYYLKHSLIILYFSIQKVFEAQLQQTVSLDDFYLLDFGLPVSAIQQIQYIDKPNAGMESKIYTSWTNQLNSENTAIEQIEISLRRFIITTYSINTINEYKEIVPSHIQEKIKTNIEKEQKKNPALVTGKNNSPEYLLQFSDLQELQAILVATNNWSKVQEVFGTKENLAIEFNNLAGLRNPIRHSREVDEVSLLKGKAAIKWFKQQLKIE